MSQSFLSQIRARLDPRRRDTPKALEPEAFDPPAALAGSPLPPVNLRAGGVHFRGDAAFLASATREANRIVADSPGSEPLRILDVGCGAGRLAYGLIATGAPVERYAGVDVMAAPIEWCQEAVSTRHPAYEFHRIDVYNERYNPTGASTAETAQLPFGDASFDVVYAFSVLSHMVSADVRAYFREFARLMTPGGIAIVTAFVEDDVPDEAINPTDYGPMSWSGALHCVRYSRPYMIAMAAEAGLNVSRLDHASEEDRQSRLILRAG